MVWLIIIIALAAAIRFYDPVFRSLWGDEAHSVFLTRSLSVAALAEDSHLPVYFMVLAGWEKIAGIGEYNLRLLSIIIGLTSMVMLFIFVKELLGEKAALYSSFLLAVSPLAVMHSQEIRMYGLLMMLAILSGLFFWRLLKNTNLLNAAFYIIFTSMMALTHVYGILIVAAEFIYLLVALIRKETIKHTLLLFAVQIVPILIVLPFYLPLLLNFSQAMSGTADMAFAVFPAPLKLALIFFVLTLGETVAPWNWPVVIPAGLLFGDLLIWALKGIKQSGILFILIMTAIPILTAALFLPPTMPKYLIICLPFYLALAGFGLAEIKWPALRIAGILIVVAVSFVSISNYFSLKEYHNSNQIEPWREAAQLIRSNYKAGDIIIASKYFTAYRLLNYYLNPLNIYCLQKSNYTSPPFNHINYPIFSREKNYEDVIYAKAKRIWLVTHILDDRTFPDGYVEALKERILNRYKLDMEKNYVPYEQTLAAKLPIGRHKTGSSRINLYLYVK